VAFGFLLMLVFAVCGLIHIVMRMMRPPAEGGGQA
jgi:hypothetical protein